MRDYNLILVIVDRSSIQVSDLHSVYDSTVRFVTEDMSENDLVGVFVLTTRPILFQNFTSDKSQVIDYVLRRAPKEEEEKILVSVASSLDALDVFIHQGAEKAMNGLHQRRS